MPILKKCSGSGGMQMIDWLPDSTISEEFPKGYPGAVVCIACSYGVLIVRGSDHDAVSQSGFKGRAGKVRVHYVSSDLYDMSYRKGRK